MITRSLYLARVKLVMETYLRQVGWPGISNEQILMELPGLYERLCDARLIPPQMNYGIFRQIALVKYQAARLGMA